MVMEKMVSDLSSAMAPFAFSASVVLLYAIFRRNFPEQLQDDIDKYGRKLVNFAYPYTEITFDEFTGEQMKRSEAFTAIQNYLSDKSSASATRLKADSLKDSESVIFSMDYNEEVIDEFRGVKVWWASSRNFPRTTQILISPRMDERRYYKLTFHNSHKELITKSYIKHVLKKGKAMGTENLPRKLYSNNPSRNWDGYNQTKWSHVIFEHPATFNTLAMETRKKDEIKNDLDEFRTGEEYYARIGKAWKRGYLLYGPPGTGKSTLIAAMANHLKYDVYDLELTTVKDNTELRRLLIEISSKSIIVIEDIDCSLDLTGQRENEKKKKSKKEKDDEEKDPFIKKLQAEETTESKVTLSGLLNFIDGLWSSCGGERIIVFTTNYLEKLDPALIRRGRMDKKIEVTYCCFEAFEVLARNYLQIDSHPLFEKIGTLLGKTKMTPADVAENLMRKSKNEQNDTCLNRLIEALEAAKEEEEGKKAEEDDRGGKEKRKRSNNVMTRRKKRTVR